MEARSIPKGSIRVPACRTRRRPASRRLSPKTNPLQCNYLSTTAPGLGPFSYLYIPNPQTGSFLFDNYQQPSSIVGNLQVSYDVSPRIRLMVLGANLFHSCFGGTSAPWTTAIPPSNVVCGYAPAGVRSTARSIRPTSTTVRASTTSRPMVRVLRRHSRTATCRRLQQRRNRRCGAADQRLLQRSGENLTRITVRSKVGNQRSGTSQSGVPAPFRDNGHA